MWIEALLIVWMSLALVWWIVSVLIVRRRALPPPVLTEPDPTAVLTVFKPLPRLQDPANLDSTASALSSFVAQLDAHSEIIFGIHPDEVAKWRPTLSRWKKDFPYARLKIVIPDDDSATDLFANRKVTWQKLLAPHALGQIWMWSDADITAPPGYLAESRSEFLSSGAGLLTHAYVVRQVRTVPDLLNALFVNVEIHPGVRLVGKSRDLCFGLGAGLVFARKDFEARIDWGELGRHLADDFQLGNRLKPAKLGSTLLETFSGSLNLKDSLLHYLRWQKTIRWCNPIGFASQIVILPVLGWLFCVLFPQLPAAWTGLALTTLLETIWVALLFRFTGCRPRPGFYCLIPVWSILRVFAFLACWLPWPVIWRSQVWWRPVRRT